MKVKMEKEMKKALLVVCVLVVLCLLGITSPVSAASDKLMQQDGLVLQKHDDNQIPSDKGSKKGKKHAVPHTEAIVLSTGNSLRIRWKHEPGTATPMSPSEAIGDTDDSSSDDGSGDEGSSSGQLSLESSDSGSDSDSESGSGEGSGSPAGSSVFGTDELKTKMDELTRKTKKKLDELNQNEQKRKQAGRAETVAKKNAKTRAAAAKRKHAIEQAKKRNSVDLTGLCGFAKRCPSGWQNRGLVGEILRKSHYRHNPFNSGAGFDNGWRWTYPYLCCAKSRHVNIRGIVAMAKSCGGKGQSRGLFGIVMHKNHYRYNPFSGGSSFNRWWRWIHPYGCLMSGNEHVKSGTCLIGKSCPRGWKNLGWGGVIMNKRYLSRSPFNRGGRYNSGWQWVHPRICCKQ